MNTQKVTTILSRIVSLEWVRYISGFHLTLECGHSAFDTVELAVGREIVCYRCTQLAQDMRDHGASYL